MTAWRALDPNVLIPQGLTAAVTALGDVLTTSLGTVKNPLDASASLGLPSLDDPVTAVVNGILATLTDILRGGRLHMLAVPIAKTIPGKAPPPLPNTIQDLESMLAVRLGPTSSAANLAYSDMIGGAGGNAGFYQTFATAINNAQDPNRPQYIKPTDAVFMAVLLVGAPRFSAVVSAATTLNQLTQPIGDNDLTARVVPVPQNLSAKVVGAAAPTGMGVRLSWDAPPPANTPRYFPGIALQVKRYAVIRTTDRKATQATSVLGLFNTAALTVGLTAGAHKVLQIGSGQNTTYVDTDAPHDPKVPVYYFVAWECTLTEQDQQTTLPFNRLSNLAKVAITAPPTPPANIGTSWKATPSALAAFPLFNSATLRLVEESRVLLQNKTSATSRINAAVALTQTSAQRLGARSADLIADVQRLATVLAAPIPRLYATQMSSKQGGNGYLLAELATRLGDTTDTTRPPFDNGEYVCGICFVAGAPRLADLANISAFFSALFGAPTPSNPILGVLDALDTLVTQAENAVFQPNMTVFPPGTDLTPINPATGIPTAASLPVTAADGSAVTSASAANPNAGDTNNTPRTALCSPKPH